MIKLRTQASGVRETVVLFMLSAFCVLSPALVFATTAETYDPLWAGELNWASGIAPFATPLGSRAYLENQYDPWWVTQVAHPITDYDAAKLPVGGVRLDSAVDVEMTMHRALRGWDVQSSPTNINNVYTFTPGGSNQQAQTARSGQYAFFDFGAHPLPHISADIGAELVGNYDQTYWFPVNDEHRMNNDGEHAKIVRGEVKYDDGTYMARAFEGIANYGWVSQNDLFGLLPTQADVEKYRRDDGSLSPRGGEVRAKSDTFGSLDVMGGAETVWTYGTSLFAKYDAPTWGGWENSLVYSNTHVPFSYNPDETRWGISYNSSWPVNDWINSHFGVLYQPFRLDQNYVVVNNVSPGQGVDGSTFQIQQKETNTSDALGFTWRVEGHPKAIVDQAGVGYTYLGPSAGNKNEVDADAGRPLMPDWRGSVGYTYRHPVEDPVPLLYEGTASNPGALLANPRGPDDPLWVQWDNREAHILSLTLLYNPDPAANFFRYTQNDLAAYNLNPDVKAVWSGAIQYRLTYYPTDTDRMWYFDENRNLQWDPIYHTGALATSYPLSSFTGILRWCAHGWRVIGDVSSGEALAGNAIAYTSQTNFYKPDTIFIQTGISVDNGVIKGTVRWSQDVWGPEDYQAQLGWTYHHIYQASLSYIFLKNAEFGVRYTGTRMTNDFIGSDTGAFNEYNAYLTYHFTLEGTLGKKFENVGRPLPKALPEVSLAVDVSSFTPDGSGPIRTVTLTPHAFSEAGLLSWQLTARDSKGTTVRQWDGRGAPPPTIDWDGKNTDGTTVPVGVYQLTLGMTDLYGNQATAPAQNVEVQTKQAPAEYNLTPTPEGLKVTLSSRVLFDTGKSQLKEHARHALDQVIKLLEAYPTNRLSISGHTDSTGSNALNDKLSWARADAVAHYLAEHGISRKRMTIEGDGKRRPVASNSTEEGRQQNRRVEIVILK